MVAPTRKDFPNGNLSKTTNSMLIDAMSHFAGAVAFVLADRDRDKATEAIDSIIDKDTTTETFQDWRREILAICARTTALLEKAND